MTRVSLADHRALAAFRYELRRFLAFSERAARSADIEPQQHQLLLAVRGLPADREPTIGAVAERLCLEHHTTVALVDKLEARGFVRRERASDDRRKVLVVLEPPGVEKLEALSRLHKAHLATAGEPMLEALRAILGDLNEGYVGSVARSDVGWFERHLTADFLNTNPDGSLVDKAGFLKQIAPPAKIKDLACSDVNVRIMGDFAIIHARTTYSYLDGRPGQGRYTDIWARRDGRWLCVAAQVARV